MTCIVGIETTDGNVIIASDSLGSNEQSKATFRNSKVFKHSGMIFGYTTSFRFGQIIEVLLDNGTLSPPALTESVYKFLIKTFIPVLKKTLEEQGAEPGDLLIGVNSELWEIYSDYSALRTESGYSSIGSGSFFALGCLFSSLNSGTVSTQNAKEIIELSIQAASNFSPSCGGSCNIVYLKD